MRGILIAGLAGALLLVGILVIKNMGADDSHGVSQTQAKKYIERAEDVAGKAAERIKKIGEQIPESD
ncbi:MAG: hypothetical protein V2I56_20765 [Desulfobacteraceae bacterium]|nr:hypothetical protein [Desulfobacteraceae bacterium]